MRKDIAYLHVLLPRDLHRDLAACAEAVGADDLSSWLRPELRKLANRTLAKHGDPRKEGK